MRLREREPDGPVLGCGDAVGHRLAAVVRSLVGGVVRPARVEPLLDVVRALVEVRRERPGDAVGDVLAAHRRAVLVLHAVAQRELPDLAVAVHVLAGVGGQVADEQQLAAAVLLVAVERAVQHPAGDLLHVDVVAGRVEVFEVGRLHDGEGAAAGCPVDRLRRALVVGGLVRDRAALGLGLLVVTATVVGGGAAAGGGQRRHGEDTCQCPGSCAHDVLPSCPAAPAGRALMAVGTTGWSGDPARRAARRRAG